MSASVYIESSVISYLTARPSRDVVTASRQAITAEWWQSKLSRYEAYVSVLVIEEISAGDPEAAEQRLNVVATLPVVGIHPEALPLADALLKSKAVPANSDRDALHIALAAYQGAEFLLTWNFKHINNAETRGSIIKVVAEHGLVCPILCSPEELSGGGHEE